MPDQEQEIARASAWIDRALIRDAKIVASHEGVGLSEVLERHLRPGLSRDMKRVIAKLAETAGAK